MRISPALQDEVFSSYRDGLLRIVPDDSERMTSECASPSTPAERNREVISPSVTPVAENVASSLL